MWPAAYLRRRADVENHNLVTLQPCRQFATVDQIDSGVITQVGAGQPLQTGNMLAGHIPQRLPQRSDPVARERVEDPGTSPPSGEQPGSGHGPEVVGRVGHTLPGPISAEISSTGRSPWPSRSTISARRPLARAFATSANPSYSASFSAR